MKEKTDKTEKYQKINCWGEYVNVKSAFCNDDNNNNIKTVLISIDSVVINWKM